MNLSLKPILVYMITSGNYAYYIPFFLHFLQKAYPKYDCIVSHKGDLPKSINAILDKHFRPKYQIWERAFQEYPDNPDVVKMLRWFAYTPVFENYQTVFIGDIDILTIKEEQGIYEQHSEIMKKYNTCYSNTDKIDDPEIRGHMMTGIHCVNPNEYYPIMRNVMEKYVGKMKRGEYVEEFHNKKLSLGIENQHGLYELIKQSGFKMPEHSFFNYHGLHLGHSRCQGRWEVFFQEDKQHINWYKGFLNQLDDRFFEIYISTIPSIKKEFLEMVTAGEKYVKKCSAWSSFQE